MPSSSFVTPQLSNQRVSFDPKTGKHVPFSPWSSPYARLPMLYHVQKLRKPNPFLINANNFSYY